MNVSETGGFSPHAETENINKGKRIMTFSFTA